MFSSLSKMIVLTSFILIFITTILLYSIYYYFKYYHRAVVLSMKIPGPPALPIIGNGLKFIGVTSEDVLIILTAYRLKYGERFRLWLGTELNIHSTSIKDAEELLSNSKFNDKADEYKILHPWLREGLLVSSRQKWFKRRKIITPAFHFQILEQFVEIFDNQSSILIENLLKCKNKDKIDLNPFINLYTLDVICETAMGVKINAQQNSDSVYVKAIKDMSTISYTRMTNVLYRYDFIFNLMPIGRKQKKALQIIHDFSDKVITARREEILRNQQSENDTTTSTKKRRMAFLDILLQSKIDDKPLSNLDIREEVDTFMFEGHDTTTSAIHFLLYFLARYPDAQRKCYEEICKVLDSGDKNKPITHQNLQNLKYLELCIKETLRLCPSVPIFGRKLNQECVIDGILYPAGTNFGLSTYGLGRLEEVYSNPLEFIPERFEGEKSTEKCNPFAYIPFSAGPRNCIGQKFAMLEIKSIVSKILRYYELEYVGDPEGPQFTFNLILRSSNILWFKLKSRN